MKTVFLYYAYDHEGKEIQGEIEATDKKEAFELVRQQECFPIEINPKEATNSRKGIKKEKAAIVFGSVDLDELGRFTANFAMLSKSNIPLAMGLKMLKEQCKKGHIKNALIASIPEIEAGTPISEAWSKFPKAFDSIYLNTIRAGEEGGAMVSVLERLASDLDKRSELQKKFKDALSYPAISLGLGIIVFSFLLWYAIPIINQFIKGMTGSTKLPWLTVKVLAFAEIFKSFWYLFIVAFIVLGLLYRLIICLKRGRFWIDFIKLKLPLLGQLTYKRNMSNFLRTLATLLKSGVPLDRALQILHETTANAYLQKCFLKIYNNVVAGFPLDFCFREHKIFDELTINMFAIGEQTGNLKEILFNLSSHYDSEVERLLQKFIKLLTPMLMILLGIFILIFGLAFMLPIFKVYQGFNM